MRKDPIDLEIIPGNSLRKALSPKSPISPLSRVNLRRSVLKSPKMLPAGQAMRASILLDMLNGDSEMYLEDRKFYCNGFDRLRVELTGHDSFWWDANGSLRRVSVSAFDETMNLQRKMGILDLDETEAEKKKRLEAEAKEKAKLMAITVSHPLPIRWGPLPAEK